VATPIAADQGTREPDDAIIVPLDSWRRMLIQLGNLHETGQQLADAKERAARAETESMFLKERLSDLRQELDDLKTASAASAATGSGAAGGSENPQESTPADDGPAPVDEASRLSGSLEDRGDDDVARTAAGRAVDQMVELAARTWKKRRGG
jgi:hypothetical protein